MLLHFLFESLAYAAGSHLCLVARRRTGDFLDVSLRWSIANAKQTEGPSARR